MKKSILKALFFTLFLFGTQKGISQSSNLELTDLKTTDELFKIKNTITENNSIDFLKQFYIVSLVENKSKNEELIFALNNIIEKDNFTCGELNAKKVENFIKKCKSKTELLKEIENNYEASGSFIEEGAEEGIKDYQLIKLTNEVYGLNSRACGSGGGYHDQFVLISTSESESRFILGEDFISGIMFTAKRKLESKLKTTFERQSAKAQSHGTTKINGEDYVTLPYYQGNENPGGFMYNLIIAYSFKTNKFFYLHDNPNSETDDWKRDKKDMDFQYYTWVTEKNPKWIAIE